MKQFFLILIIANLIWDQTGSVSAQNYSPSPDGASSYWLKDGPVGSATTNFFNIFKKKKRMRDSVITSIENSWGSSRQLIEKDNYAEAVSNLEKIITEIDTYIFYCRKNRKTTRVHLDTVQTLLSNCKLLQSLTPLIAQVNMWSDSIADNVDDLVMQNRHHILAIKARCKDIINSEINLNPDKKGAIRFGFRKSIIKLNLLDSLLESAYIQEKNTFSLKSRFFYNRAIETNDSVQIRSFVEDCDYYQIDKEWCTRARMILNGIGTQSSDTVVSVFSKKLSDNEVMKIQYQQAMVSRRIDLLEEYIAKYGRIRIRKSESKVDSVQVLLKKIKKEIENEMAYNKAHPLFSNADISQLTIFIKGLSETVQIKYRESINKHGDYFKAIPGIRFPANLQIDYASSNPILFLNAHLNCQKDVQISSTDSGTVYSINGIPQLMQFLNSIKKTAAELVTDKVTAEKLSQAAYVVRLRKNADDYVTFYGKENLNAAISDENEFLFYDFFDITVKDQKDVRFTYKPTHVIEILKSKGESQKNLLWKSFFEK